MRFSASDLIFASVAVALVVVVYFLFGDATLDTLQGICLGSGFVLLILAGLMYTFGGPERLRAAGATLYTSLVLLAFAAFIFLYVWLSS